MDIAEVKKIIDADYRRIKKVVSQYAYYSGNHPGIYYDAAKEDPDNRVPVPIVRKAVQFILGYMFKPGNIQYTGAYYDSTLKDIFAENEESLLDSELALSALVTGKAFEAHWTDGGREYFAQIPTTQGIMVKSDDIVPRDIAFIRYWRDSSGALNAWVYDDSTIAKYRGADSSSLQNYETVQHGYKSVPVLEVNISPDGSNLFDHVLPLVDLMDKGLSEDIANEMQRYANAYLLMAEDMAQEDADKVKIVKVFKNLRDNVREKIAFLEKNLNPEFVNTALDRIERLCYEMLGVPNPGDETFASAVSGTALAYRLLPFEYLCASIETYFIRFLQRRIRLIGNLDSTINGTDGDVSEVDIKLTRNLPANVTEAIDNAVKLSTIVSKETMLASLPVSIVPDVEEEMARLDKEAQDSAELFSSDNMATDNNADDTSQGITDENTDKGINA